MKEIAELAAAMRAMRRAGNLALGLLVGCSVVIVALVLSLFIMATDRP